MIIDENSHRQGYKYIRIESENDDYGEIFDNIKKSFENKVGKINEGEEAPEKPSEL